MAKGRKRGNREAKKPKTAVPKPPAGATSPFARPAPAGGGAGAKPPQPGPGPARRG